MTIDKSDKYAYVADKTGGKVYVLDIDPDSDSYHQVVKTIVLLLNNQNAQLQQIATSSNSKRLFVTASDSQVYVINIDPNDRPLDGESNSRKWWEQIGAVATATGAMGLSETSDPLKMTFTNGSQLTDGNGFGVLNITNDDPNSFAATANYINLSLDSFRDYFDVDEGVAVTILKDGSYAFVAGRDSRGNAGTSTYPDKREGGNVGIIKDPLGDNPRLVAATRPIPGSLTNNVVLSFDDKYLMASYPTLNLGGAVYVFDVEEIIETISTLELKANGSDSDELEVYWLDSRNRGEGSVAFEEGSKREVTFGDLVKFPIDDINPDISVAADYEIIGGNWVNQFTYGVPLDTQRSPIGIGGNPMGLASVSVRDVVELVSPGESGVADSLNPTLKWNFNIEGDGNEDEDSDLMAIDPNDVKEVNLYVSVFPEGEGLLPTDRWSGLKNPEGGKDYNPNRVLTAKWNPGNNNNWTWKGGSSESGDSPLPQEFTLPDELRLTGGQTYHWAVEVVQNGTKYLKTGEFKTSLGATGGSDTFSSVSILTRGSEPREQEIDRQLETMADHITKTGVGLVMHYEASTGKWYWENSQGIKGYDIPFDLNNKPLVLIPGWEQIPEQTSNNSGFSEAKADSLFSSLVTLNRNLGNDMLFNAPWHFVGVGQGTIVNSEIIQRFGTFFPKKDNPNKFPDLQMTTIDIPESKQDSLFPDLKTLNEPEVKVWENVTFADNYYQTTVKQEATSTTTPAGSSFPGVDWEVFLGGTNSDSSRIEFDVDDRKGSPHKRALSWYAGTADLSQRHIPPLEEETTFPGVDNPEKEVIYRRLGDLDISEQNANREETWYTPDYRGYSLVHGSQNAPWEGIGTGWFYSVLGGGVNQRHDALLGVRTPVSEDNTVLARMRGDFAVPTLFNGNFDAITESRGNQSIPGWSFDNGDEPNALQKHLVEWSRITSLSADYRTGVGYTPEEANYALKLSPGKLDEITHNSFVVPEWGTLRFNLHIPETLPRNGELGAVKVLIKGDAPGYQEEYQPIGTINLERAGGTPSLYLRDTTRIGYGTQGFESFHVDVPQVLRGKTATLKFEVNGTTVYLDDVFFKSSHLKLGKPTLSSDANDYLIEKPQYSLSYNSSTKGPNWVSYQLDQTWVGNLKTPGSSAWKADPMVSMDLMGVDPSDYTGSFPYDRGHLVTRSHRNRNDKDQIATFLMTNVLPQHNQNNSDFDYEIDSNGNLRGQPRSAWYKFERYLRSLVEAENKQLYVISGGFGSQNQELDENHPLRLNNINVPSATWKVVVVLEPGQGVSDITETTRVIALVTPNTERPENTVDNPLVEEYPVVEAWRDWGNWRYSIDFIEEQIGFDLLSNIPIEIQNSLESRVDSRPTAAG